MHVNFGIAAQLMTQPDMKPASVNVGPTSLPAAAPALTSNVAPANLQARLAPFRPPAPTGIPASVSAPQATTDLASSLFFGPRAAPATPTVQGPPSLPPPPAWTDPSPIPLNPVTGDNDLRRAVAAQADAVKRSSADLDRFAKQMAARLDEQQRAIGQVQEVVAKLVRALNGHDDQLTSVSKGLSAVSASADQAQRSVATLAANVEQNLAALDEQLRGQGDAITQVARSMGETFSPARVARPVPSKPARYTPAPKVMPASRQVGPEDAEVVDQPPEVQPALQGWGWATKL